MHRRVGGHHSPLRNLGIAGLLAGALVLVSIGTVAAVTYGTPTPMATPAATSAPTATPAATSAPTAAPTATPAGSVAGATGAPSSVKLGLGSTAALGKFLTGPNGRTLYTLSSDPNNGSICLGQCVTFWPVLAIAPGGTISAPSGVTGAFGMFTRSDGPTQVTYKSRAVYYFKNDTAAGQTNGEGIQALGGTWHVARAAVAAAVSSTPVTPPSTSTSTSQATLPTGVLLTLLALAALTVGLFVLAPVSRRSRRR